MKKFKSFIIVCMFVLTCFHVDNIYAATGTLEKKMMKQTRDELLSDPDFCSDYDKVAELVLDSYMTSTRRVIKAPKEILDRLFDRTLLSDAFAASSDKTYNLNNIIDSMAVSVLSYADDYAMLFVDGVTYNDSLKIDYEDYYQSILNNIDIKNMSDYDKVYYIDKYVRNSFDYLDTSNSSLQFPTLSSAANNRGFICGNYAAMMKALLNRAGVNCIIVFGTSDNVEHAWNLVKIDSKWYWLDTTWNDVSDSDEYLLKGNSLFLETHDIPESYMASLRKYNISDSDCDSKLSKPMISGISISNKKILYVDYQFDDSDYCYMYLDDKQITNNKKVNVKNNSEIRIKFIRSGRKSIEYKYQVIKVGKSYKLVKL